ncbi:hypothetical protein DEH84_18380 (plasmid) [Aquabacterium olei]|uniref:Uncharacterized protein n=1 Tax=Aquabacterium olei TaxID=1296669 RepID=A0A2U8FX10_9BURK|nr:hypothetical protein [Aquabacterium olei]AWI55550.1 hypothetical protein DEH84_18380 [Aquabacterium olei]
MFEQWFARPIADIVHRPLEALLVDEAWTRKLKAALNGGPRRPSWLMQRASPGEDLPVKPA